MSDPAPLPASVRLITEGRRWFRVLNGAPYVLLAWEAVAEHRAQIEFNHGQTLEDLNARGGLDWYELYCGMTGRDLFPAVKVSIEDARATVLRMVQNWSFEHDTRCGSTSGRPPARPLCKPPSARKLDTPPRKRRSVRRGKGA
jgi:hypothetical protein